jgi:hypothetical protein
VFLTDKEECVIPSQTHFQVLKPWQFNPEKQIADGGISAAKAGCPG